MILLLNTLINNPNYTSKIFININSATVNNKDGLNIEDVNKLIQIQDNIQHLLDNVNYKSKNNDELIRNFQTLLDDKFSNLDLSF